LKFKIKNKKNAAIVSWYENTSKIFIDVLSIGLILFCRMGVTGIDQ